MELKSYLTTKSDVNQKTVEIFKLFTIILLVVSVCQVFAHSVLAVETAAYEHLPSAIPFKLLQTKLLKKREPVEERQANNHQQEIEFNSLEDRYEGEISYFDAGHHYPPETEHKHEFSSRELVCTDERMKKDDNHGGIIKKTLATLALVFALPLLLTTLLLPLKLLLALKLIGLLKTFVIGYLLYRYFFNRYYLATILAAATTPTVLPFPFLPFYDSATNTYGTEATPPFRGQQDQLSPFFNSITNRVLATSTATPANNPSYG